VISDGTPMWLQDSPWSRALRGFLEQWLGSPATSTCGTDDADVEPLSHGSRFSFCR
jgi:hypothetical protein